MMMSSSTRNMTPPMTNKKTLTLKKSRNLLKISVSDSVYKSEEFPVITSILGGGRHMKGGVLPAYCDPPNPCPKGYTAEDGCIEVEEFENRAEFSRKYQVRRESIEATLINDLLARIFRLHRTACVTQNTCFLVRMSTHSTQCTKISRFAQI